MRALPPVAVVVVAILLTACSSIDPNDEPDTASPPSPSISSTDEVSAPSPTAHDEADADTVCEAVVGDLSGDSLIGRIPDAILAIGDQLGDQDLAELIDINDDLGRALETAPPEYATVIRSLKEPFQQVQDVVSSGGGQLDMDTSRVQTDVADLMELCSADGYTVS